jgi:hypothetical protein
VIDKGLGAWPQEVVAAAKKFQQGDLIAKPPIAYAASLANPVWELTRQEAADGEHDDMPVHLAIDPDDGPPFGIITSQTCDVAEDRPDPLQPWFEVSPVVLCKLDDPLAGRDYTYPLRAFPAPEDEIYVVDLRLGVSIEKGLLVDRQPVDPFAGSEEERIAFGVMLGRRRTRAALSENVHVFIDQTLNDHKPRKTGKRVKKRLYKLLLQITEGGRLDPRAVRLHVITVENDDATIELPEIEGWFQSWYDEAREVTEQQGVTLLAPVFHDAANMDIRLYDSLIEIRTPF